MELLLAALGLCYLLGAYIMQRKAAGQRKLDLARKYYEVVFPLDMDERDIHAFIRAIGKNLKPHEKKRDRVLNGVPTLVFETWSSPKGLSHRIRVPEDSAVYITGQLQSALPGIELREVEPTDIAFQYGAELRLVNGSEELPIASAVDYSHRILASMQDAVQPHDAVCVSWVIAHSNNQKSPPSDKPVKTNRGSFLSYLTGNTTRQDTGAQSSLWMASELVLVSLQMNLKLRWPMM